MKRPIIPRSGFALASTIALLASRTQAQTTTSLLFLGFPDAASLAGTIVGAAPTATTYEINCQPGSVPGTCGLYNARITDSPSAYDFSMSVGDDINVSAHCSKTSGIPDHCVESAGGKLAYKPGVVTTTVQSIDYKYIPVTIVEGLENVAPTITSLTSGTVTTNTATTSSTSSNASPGSSSSSSSTSSSSTPSIDIPAWAEPTASPSTSSEVSSATVGPNGVANNGTLPGATATGTRSVAPTPTPSVITGGAAMLCPLHAAGAAFGLIFAAMLML